MIRIQKDTTGLGMPWETEYGYAQAVRVGNTIYLAGQVSHDAQGSIVGDGNMELQMRQAYANVAKVLARYGATIENVVEETLFVTRMDEAFAARAACREEVFGGHTQLASTIVQVERLAFPQLMVEIKCTARLLPEP
jgi:enamine deaminase RidA (YjgF/YER057c/UK114 family)